MGETILEIVLAGVMQIVLWVGAIILVGIAIALLNTLFYFILGRNSRGLCIATGLIGTPIHELGHAFFCVIFAHKITEIKLFQFHSEDGTLGYVTHSYNPKNIYQRIGQFFIGVGPILFGSGILLLLEFLLARPTFFAMASLMEDLSFGMASGVGNYFGLIGSALGQFFAGMFSLASLRSPLWWVFVVLGCMISLHMRLSKPDIKGAMLGLWLTIIIVGIVPIIVGAINLDAMRVMTSAMTTGAIYVICVYMLAIMFSVLMVILSLIKPLVKLIVKLVKLIILKKAA